MVIDWSLSNVSLPPGTHLLKGDPAAISSQLISSYIVKKVSITGSTRVGKLILKQAAENGLVNLAGHGSVGGVRASIYNAMSFDGVKALVEFMRDFEKNYE